jgi:indolepyruvate ferredoxin oxidoreductase beta subunit
MMIERDPLNLMVCGTGGQGNVLLSRFLARTFVKKGYRTTIGETFGVSQRGGAVMSHVRVSKKRSYGPLIPEGRGHVILSLEPMETLRVLGSFGNPEVAVISNVRPVYPMASITGENDYPDITEMKRIIQELSARCWFIDATKISLEMGNPMLTNMAMVGALLQTGEVNLSKSDIEAAMRETFSDKVAETNMKALIRGIQAVESR